MADHVQDGAGTPPRAAALARSRRRMARGADEQASGSASRTGAPTPEPDLETWKELAAHVERSTGRTCSTRTVQRWADRRVDPMPVIRPKVCGRVFGNARQIDRWLERQGWPVRSEPASEAVAHRVAFQDVHGRNGFHTVDGEEHAMRQATTVTLDPATLERAEALTHRLRAGLGDAGKAASISRAGVLRLAAEEGLRALEEKYGTTGGRGPDSSPPPAA